MFVYRYSYFTAERPVNVYVGSVHVDKHAFDNSCIAFVQCRRIYKYLLSM